MLHRKLESVWSVKTYCVFTHSNQLAINESWKKNGIFVCSQVGVTPSSQQLTSSQTLKRLKYSYMVLHPSADILTCHKPFNEVWIQCLAL